MAKKKQAEAKAKRTYEVAFSEVAESGECINKTKTVQAADEVEAVKLVEEELAAQGISEDRINIYEVRQDFIDGEPGQQPEQEQPEEQLTEYTVLYRLMDDKANVIKAQDKVMANDENEAVRKVVHCLTNRRDNLGGFMVHLVQWTDKKGDERKWHIENPPAYKADPQAFGIRRVGFVARITKTAIANKEGRALQIVLDVVQDVEGVQTGLFKFRAGEDVFIEVTPQQLTVADVNVEQDDEEQPELFEGGQNVPSEEVQEKDNAGVQEEAGPAEQAGQAVPTEEPEKVTA